MLCRECRYALEGLTTNRCPECGRPFDPANPRTYRPAPALKTRPKSRAGTPEACVKCGYDLAGVPSGACPECGHAFTPRPTTRGTLPRSSSQLARILRRLRRLRPRR